VYSTQSQAQFIINSYKDVTYNNVNLLDGWVYDGTSQLTCAQAGLYYVTFMAKAGVLLSGVVSMHATKNGAILAGAQTDLRFDPGNAINNMSQAFLARFAAGDTLKVQWASDSLSASLYRTQVNPGEGLTASLTVTRVA
jgi:hypothetical protein